MSPEDLLKGTFYALEQCGLLLRHANILYRSGSYLSTVVLTAFAREELGRYRILLGLWRRARAGEVFTADDIRNTCGDHVAKQKEGMLSVNIMADRDSVLGTVLRATMENHPQSPAAQEARATLKKIDQTKIKNTPNKRHEKRISALYVEPVSETRWNRPVDAVSAMVAHDFLVDAVNDYRSRYHQGYITSAILKEDDPDLYGAIEKWADRPELPAPECPKWPE